MRVMGNQVLPLNFQVLNLFSRKSLYCCTGQPSVSHHITTSRSATLHVLGATQTNHTSTVATHTHSIATNTPARGTQTTRGHPRTSTKKSFFTLDRANSTPPAMPRRWPAVAATRVVRAPTHAPCAARTTPVRTTEAMAVRATTHASKTRVLLAARLTIVGDGAWAEVTRQGVFITQGDDAVKRILKFFGGTTGGDDTMSVWLAVFSSWPSNVGFARDE